MNRCDRWEWQCREREDELARLRARVKGLESVIAEVGWAELKQARKRAKARGE